MNIEISNLGCLGHTSVELNGITVLAGFNGTGKSTLSKALFALIYSSEDLPNKLSQACNNYVITECRNLFYLYAPMSNKMTEDLVVSDPLVSFMKDLRSFMTHYSKKEPSEWISYFSDVEQKLALVPPERFDSLLSKNRSRATASGEAKKAIIRSLEEILQSLRKVLNLTQFHRFALKKSFLNEFSHQIGGIETDKETSVRLYSGESVFYDVSFAGGQPKKVFFNSAICPLTRAVYLDDPYILDRLNSAESYFSIVDTTDDPDFNFGPFQESDFLVHSGDLAGILSSHRSSSLVSEIVNNEKAKAFREAISSVLPENLQENNSKLYYGKKKIDIRNLATGLKWFVILELLLEKGLLDDKTLLIFDEPEVHLHPAWQNVMANLLIVINRTFGCQLLISTHSPNFLMALQVDAQQKGVPFDIYQSQSFEGSYRFVKKDDCISDVYGDLAEPTFENDQKYMAPKKEK
jgi:energy-coupling factor transporter ATP-binding protein EcfA2